MERPSELLPPARVLLAHPGTQYSYQLARELNHHAYLDRFHTTLAMREGSPVARVLRPLAEAFGQQRALQNRTVSGVKRGQLFCDPWTELQAMYAVRTGADVVGTRQLRNQRFQNRIPEESLDRAQLVIGFDTSSWILAQRTRDQGKPFVLDRSIAHPRAYRRVVEVLRAEYPEWLALASVKGEEGVREEDLEHALAELIVVPSRFVARTLEEQGVPAAKMRINPFGTDPTLFYPGEPRPETGLLRFLFAGNLSARKGLPLLLDAWRQLNPRGAELWIVGTGRVPEQARHGLPESIKWLGPASRTRMAEILRETDVLVFPSLFEGLAQVQVEAAASGVPVIGTTASGADEIVISGETGLVLAPGNLAELMETLRLLLQDPTLISRMKVNCRAQAGRWAWRDYGDRWIALLQEVPRC